MTREKTMEQGQSSTARTTAESPKFREGDVVRWSNGDESVIRPPPPENAGDIFGENIYCVGPGWKKGWARASSLTLLRRPVRECDFVRWASQGTADGVKYRVERIRPDGGVTVSWAGDAHHCDLKPGWERGYVHADGTPIEPPQKTSGAPNVNEMVRERPNLDDKDIVSGANARALADEVAKLREALETMSRRFNEAYARANRLSDTCGDLKKQLDAAYAMVGSRDAEIQRVKKANRPR